MFTTFHMLGLPFHLFWPGRVRVGNSIRPNLSPQVEGVSKKYLDIAIL